MHHRFETDERFYEFTMWNRWQERAETGRVEDEARIRRQADEGIGPDVREDWIEDEIWIANTLTDVMFASLVVTIWSEMEHFLKGCVEECQSNLGLAVGSPSRFRQIKSFFQNATGVDLTAIPEFTMIDAVRILNNSFKHSAGVYSPQPGQAHTIINAALLARWNVVGASNRIHFSKVPFKELVLACGRFAGHLSTSTASVGGGGP